MVRARRVALHLNDDDSTVSIDCQHIKTVLRPFELSKLIGDDLQLFPDEVGALSDPALDVLELQRAELPVVGWVETYSASLDPAVEGEEFEGVSLRRHRAMLPKRPARLHAHRGNTQPGRSRRDK